MILKQSTIGGFTECKSPERTVQRSKRTDANVAATFGDPYCLHVLIKHTKSCTEAEIKIIKGEVFNFCTTSSTMTVLGQVSANTSPTCLWLNKLFVPPQTHAVGFYVESLKQKLKVLQSQSVTHYLQRLVISIY